MNNHNYLPILASMPYLINRYVAITIKHTYMYVFVSRHRRLSKIKTQYPQGEKGNWIGMAPKPFRTYLLLLTTDPYKSDA